MTKNANFKEQKIIGGMKLKVIFLDIDGVMNSTDYIINYALKNNIEGILAEIDPKAIQMLKFALDVTGAQIVLSSSWRECPKYYEELKELFSKYDINLNEKTPIHNTCKRGLEIKQYLKEHPNIEQYLILDDEIFDFYEDEELKENLILTRENPNDYSGGDGLQIKHIEQIMRRFGRAKKKEQEQIQVHEHDEER